MFVSKTVGFERTLQEAIDKHVQVGGNGLVRGPEAEDSNQAVFEVAVEDGPVELRERK